MMPLRLRRVRSNWSRRAYRLPRCRRRHNEHRTRHELSASPQQLELEFLVGRRSFMLDVENSIGRDDESFSGDLNGEGLA
jgi:hypothetical protein